MAAWRLDPKEVSTGGGEITSAIHGNLQARRGKSAELVLYHRPTKREVRGTVGPVTASKKEWRAIRQQEWDRLFKLLEEKVARHLKIKGR